ncbi:MAG: hypothetical protein MUE53_04170 [Chitinophagales bacterium]|jgi:hypothetical protein|nr:hypothetical protein [Chitinophagales bacterium]
MTNKQCKTQEFAPFKNFTANTNIRKNKSIPEMDWQLNKKYQLSEEKIAFIEKMIKPMA